MEWLLTISLHFSEYNLKSPTFKQNRHQSAS